MDPVQLADGLGDQMAQAAEFVDDMDDFVRCGQCGLFIPELVEGTEPPVRADELCRGHR